MDVHKKHVRLQFREVIPPDAGAGNFLSWRAAESGLKPILAPNGKGWLVPVVTEIDITIMLLPACNIPVVVATPGAYVTKVMLLNDDDQGDFLDDDIFGKNKATALWRMEDLVCWPDMDPAAPVVPGTPRRSYFTDQCEIPVTGNTYCAIKIEQDSEDLGGFMPPAGHADWILEYKWKYFPMDKFQAQLSVVGKKTKMVTEYDDYFINP